ncbi:hypothetical protein VPH35_014420 [Triticum aestivum]
MWPLIKIIYHMITFKGAITKLEEAAARAHGCVDSHLTRMHDFLESDLPGDDRLRVWGRRGAGKTSLLTPLRQPSLYHALFDCVLYLEVGSRWSVTDVQLGICCTRLGCSYGVMFFLLLIDGPLEAPVDLVAVGLSTPLGKGGRRQKVVVSTRSPDIGRLGEDDAWGLFRDNVGDKIITRGAYSRDRARTDLGYLGCYYLLLFCCRLPADLRSMHELISAHHGSDSDRLLGIVA